MKKLWILLFALVLALCLCACEPGETPFVKEYTFPENTNILNVNVADLNKEDAWSKLEAAAAGYSLELTVDGVAFPVSAQDIDLTCSRDAFMAGAEAMQLGASADFSGVIRFNEGKLRALMSQQFNKDATEASISFDEAVGQYVLVPHADGQKSNPNALVAAVKDAICSLALQHSLTNVSEIISPVRSADEPEVQEALALANKMIGVKLVYTFNPNGNTSTHEIPAEVIRSFVALGEDGLTPIINQEALENYVIELGEKYSIGGSSGSFKTTGGGTVNLTVSYNGHYVNNDALAQDIIKCMQEGISETRSAPYQASGTRDMAYGGTYIEINLSSQHLWFYKNGERLVSTSLVSGNVAQSMYTPTGVYSIYSKSTSTYLIGEDYKSFVNYWMPFYGGYGLHDATWRSSFGGEIYLYSGSHGCVNLPLSAAATIYRNAPVGTKVILYGGARSVEPLSQKLTGTKSYDVADDTEGFKLNIKPKYSGPKLSYSSSNPSVASVDSSGYVTVNGIGTTTITVTCPKYSYYTAADTTVTVKVHSACDDGRHAWGTPTTVKAPTCQPGLEKITCAKCGHSTEQKLDPVESHSFGDWTTTKEPTCGADGTKERTCTKCNTEKETGTVPATGNHTNGSWETVSSPTCVKDGEEVMKCTVCGKTLETRAIPKTPDTHVAGDWETVTPATCTEPGTKHKLCIHCGKEVETGTIEAGHKPGDWETVESPTCTKEGKKVKKCTVCGEEVASETIDKKKHNYNGGPSCVDCGAENPNYEPPAPTGGDDDDDDDAE